MLKSLKPHLEPENLPDEKAPVRSCYRYLINRPGQFNYQNAIKDDLPIGSGEIESAHRHVIQERLKLSGCWWKLENAMTMLALRVLLLLWGLGQLLAEDSASDRLWSKPSLLITPC